MGDDARADRLGDVRSTIRALRRFDPRGPHKLVLIGFTSFVTGSTDAVLLALMTSVALSLSRGTDPDVFGLSTGEVLLLAAGVLVINLLSGWFYARQSSNVVSEAGRTARKELVHGFFSATFEKRQSGRVASLQEWLTTYVDHLLSVFQALTQAINAALNLVSFAVAALILDGRAFLALALVGALVVAVQRPTSKRAKHTAREFGHHRKRYAEMSAESVLLSREAEVFGVGDAFERRMLEVDDLVTERNRQARFLAVFNVRIYQALAFGVILVGLFSLRDVNASELTGIASVALILLRSLTYGQALLGAFHSISDRRPHVEELIQAVDSFAEHVVVDGTRRVDEVQSVELRRVVVGFGGTRALDRLDLVIRGGETLGIIGPSGAGKSTLANVLLRLVHPTEGEVLVNGIPLADVSLASWRSAVAFVPQEPRLVHGTIADNIRFFRPIDDASMRRAAKAAHILDFIESLPMGFDSPVQELGGNLSGGQRQRICIARALAGSPRLLVLDEPTSALDGESEAAIQATLNALRGRVGMVLIAHRLSTLSICDRIAVISGGRLEAVGTADELRAGSDYFRAAMAQAGL